ncbi:Vegetative incompatibility protein HET-E-1-like protein 15 [Paraphaeosphaeria sporulosa]
MAPLRLLQRKPDSSLVFHEMNSSNIPAYAMLSHTWGKEELDSSLPKNALQAYFFSQATDPRINSATAVLRGLLHMLMSQQPSLVFHIHDSIDSG